MTAVRRWLACRQSLIGLALLGALIAPPLRQLLEARMSTHMLLQFPALILAGSLLVTALSVLLNHRIEQWNANGIFGLTTCTLVLALGMIPRVLDLALVNTGVEIIKYTALLLCGALLRLSWRAAGLTLQGFFLGNTLPMMAIVGWLYEDTPLRICNAYRVDEQQWVGLALEAVAAGVAAIWLCRAVWLLTRHEALLNRG